MIALFRPGTPVFSALQNSVIYVCYRFIAAASAVKGRGSVLDSVSDVVPCGSLDTQDAESLPPEIDLPKQTQSCAVIDLRPAEFNYAAFFETNNSEALLDVELGFRLLNALLAGLLLVALSPVIAAVALLVLLIDGRPILYRGARVGWRGTLFSMLKFRTMRPGAEALVGGRLMRSDDRVTTRLGRILRYLKLDELPQLWNIFRGDMNFIGPRPVRPLMAADYISRVPDYEQRFAVRPGLSGLAQIRGGYYCSPARKTRYDRFYIRHRSLAFDALLLIETIWYMSGSITRLKLRH